MIFLIINLIILEETKNFIEIIKLIEMCASLFKISNFQILHVVLFAH